MRNIFILIINIVFLFSCEENRYQVDKKTEDLIEVKFDYLHPEILPKTGDKADIKLKAFQSSHPTLARGIFEEIIGIGHPDSLSTQFYYAGFLVDPYITQTQKAIDSSFKDFSKYETQYQQAFQKYAHFTPEAVIPSVLFSYNNFQYAVIALDTCMLVGLEMYLGKDFEGYAGLQWPDYIKIRRDASLMVPETMTGWLMTEFPKKNEAVTFIEEVVYRGKIMFYLSKLLPELEPQQWFGYTKESYDFAKENEGSIYGFFIEKKLFYSDDKKEINKYTEEAPFATGMPRETPGRIAWFLGYEIVASYMENHKEMSIDQLMKNHDYKSIFAQSKYKPKK